MFKLSILTPIFFVTFIIAYLSPISFGGNCGAYNCTGSQICQTTCASGSGGITCNPPSSCSCDSECVDYGAGGEALTCPAGTNLSCGNPGVGFCMASNHAGPCTMVWPSRITANSLICGGNSICQTDCNCCPVGQINTCESGTYTYTYRSGYTNANGVPRPSRDCASGSDAFLSSTGSSDCRYDGYDELIDCQYTSTCKRCGCAPPPTCTIQGRKVIMPGNQQIAPATGQTVSVAGGTPGSSSANPYFISAPADGNHLASVTVPSGYTASYTLCYNSTSCHTYSYIGGSSVNVNTTQCNGGYADLYWHFTPIVTCPAWQACPTTCGYPGGTAQNGNCTTRYCSAVTPPPAGVCPTYCGYPGGDVVANGSCGTAVCPPVACSVPPIGLHFSSSCSESIGWACDGSNYSLPLWVELYRDGPKGVGTYMGAVRSNQYYAPLAYVCGGYASHGFIYPYNLANTGTHNIYAYALNIGAGSNAYLSNTPQTVECPPPPTKPITGKVWEDLNGNNTMDSSDRYWGQQGNGVCTTSMSASLQVRDVAFATNATFNCSAPSQPPAYTTPPHVATPSLSFNLTPPTGLCSSNMKWEYTVCGDAACTAALKRVGSGTGCSATITSPSALYSNTLNWMVGQQFPRTITGTLYETTDPATCSNNAALALVPSGGLSVTAYDGATQKGPTATVSAGGAYSVTGLSSADNFDKLYVNGALSDATHAYQLACLKSVGVTCNKSGASALGCSSTGTPPTPTLAAASPTVSFGFSKFGNDKWFSVLDGDMYGDSIAAYVAPLPSGNFSPNIINTQSASTIGGYGFAAATIDSISVGSNVSEKGGYAQNLSKLPSYPPTDSWLNNFGFVAPGTPITTPPSGNKFQEGKVYSLSVAQFNSILNIGSYSFELGNAGSPAASIVYVTGAGSILLNKNFVSNNNNKTLVVVTASDINVLAIPGTTLASYAVGGASQIDLVIIAKRDINFASIYNESLSKFDIPLMIYGSLVSAGTINPNRNLGFANNASYPATSIRFYPYLLGLINKYELDNASSSPYTGLATFDVQFDYGN